MKGNTRRSVVVLAVVAMIAALLAIPIAPAGAASAACDSAPSAGFTDLTGYTAETVNAVDCIAFYGVTKGTSATTYGPTGDVTRWQMALFLTRKLAAAGVTLPSGADQGFTDISGYDAATQLAINQLAQLSITKGTSATTFDPAGIVNRWQMALFMTREVVAAGVSLPTAADQGFTDISALDAATQTAINQLAQLGISKGTSATTYDPMGNVNRWQMALFLARDLDVLNVTPAGTGFIATALPAGSDITYADTSQGKEVTKTTKSTDTFYVDGALANQAIFLSNYTVGDLVAVSTGMYKLTNKTDADYTSGVIDNVDLVAHAFDFVEPISGAVLAHYDYDATAYILYTADGASVSIAGFELDIQAGDMVSVTGKGDTAAHIRTFALTNMTVSGSLSAFVAGTSISIGGYSDAFPVADGDSLTLDGDAVTTAAAFTAEATVGDAATYALKGGKVTATLTNKAYSAKSGIALVAYDDNATVTLDDDTFTMDSSGTDVVVPFGAADILSVDGVLVTAADFADALTPGDTAVYQAADGVVITKSSVQLTNTKGLSGVTLVSVGGGNATVEFSKGGTPSDNIDYTSVTPVGLSATGDVVYEINGVESTNVGEWVTDANAFITASTITPKVTISKVGNDIVWNVTS
jgi:hypothetical protein